jgi:hypothetical protein
LLSAKSEVLRYLGLKGRCAPSDLNGIVEESILLMQEASTFRKVYSSFPISSGIDGIALAGTELLLRGVDITRHLSGCTQAVLMAATLGAGADSLINRWKRADPVRSLVLDACASQLIEERCNELERQIWVEAAASGLTATRRFSPGYGDLSLDIQPGILEALNATGMIGLTCTEHCILLPRKSVTALVGLGENADRRAGGCESCNLSDTCSFRKEGNFDGC